MGNCATTTRLLLDRILDVEEKPKEIVSDDGTCVDITQSSLNNPSRASGSGVDELLAPKNTAAADSKNKPKSGPRLKTGSGPVTTAASVATTAASASSATPVAVVGKKAAMAEKSTARNSQRATATGTAATASAAALATTATAVRMTSRQPATSDATPTTTYAATSSQKSDGAATTAHRNATRKTSSLSSSSSSSSTVKPSAVDNSSSASAIYRRLSYANLSVTSRSAGRGDAELSAAEVAGVCSCASTDYDVLTSTADQGQPWAAGRCQPGADQPGVAAMGQPKRRFERILNAVLGVASRTPPEEKRVDNGGNKGKISEDRTVTEAASSDGLQRNQKYDIHSMNRSSKQLGSTSTLKDFSSSNDLTPTNDSYERSAVERSKNLGHRQKENWQNSSEAWPNSTEVWYNSAEAWLSSDDLYATASCTMEDLTNVSSRDVDLLGITDEMINELERIRDEQYLLSPDEILFQETEDRFSSLSLAFRTDQQTLDKRTELHKRARDNAEDNIKKEMEGLKATIKTLNRVCHDRSSSGETFTEVQRHIEVLEQSIARMSSAAEQHGAVQQELRVSHVVDAMLDHVEQLKRIHDHEHQELETVRKRSNTNDTGSTVVLPGHSMMKIINSRRRASVAIAPKYLLLSHDDQTIVNNNNNNNRIIETVAFTNPSTVCKVSETCLAESSTSSSTLSTQRQQEQQPQPQQEQQQQSYGKPLSRIENVASVISETTSNQNKEDGMSCATAESYWTGSHHHTVQ